MSDSTAGWDVTTETVRVQGHQGDEIEAFLARPAGDGPSPGVVVLHHMPGYDEATKQIARTFALEVGSMGTGSVGMVPPPESGGR